MPRLDFIHPRVEPQPVCADRLTVSRSRVRALVERAAAVAGSGTGDDSEFEVWYAEGVADALNYLLDSDVLPDMLAEALGLVQPSPRTACGA